MEEERKTSTTRWLIVLRGVLFLAFGLIALAYPGMTILGLVYIFGAMAVISGIVALAHFAMEKSGVFLFEGIFSIIIGILVIIYPAITAVVFVWLIVLWLLLVGMMLFVVGLSGEKGTPRAVLIISGLVMVILAVFLIVQPVSAKAWDILWVIGVLAILSGGLQVLFAVFSKKKTIEKVQE